MHSVGVALEYRQEFTMKEFAAVMWSCSRALVVFFCYAQTRSSIAAVQQEPQQFIPIDSSHLMGWPDSREVFGVENAYSNLEFTRPVDVTHAAVGSNRMFAVEQDGRVRVWDIDAATKDASVFLDLSQNLETLFGSILRIDVDRKDTDRNYAIPAAEIGRLRRLASRDARQTWAVRRNFLRSKNSCIKLQPGSNE